MALRTPVLLLLCVSAVLIAAEGESSIHSPPAAQALCGGSPCAGGAAHYSVVGELVPHEKGKGLTLKGGALSVTKYDAVIAKMERQLKSSRRALRTLATTLSQAQIIDKERVKELESGVRSLRERNDRLAIRIRNAKMTRGKRGVRGAKGPVGKPGPVGAPGRPGRQGRRGSAGPVGRRGPNGFDGPRGARGAPGQPGLPGPAGPKGVRGPRGRPGYVGPRGARGPQGRIGSQGKRGPTGLSGPRGPMGLPGPLGPRGERGLQGEVGPVGKTGQLGKRGPAGLIGRRGLRGPPGAPGKQGVRGAPGRIGLTGPRGIQGKEGAVGQPGPRGLDGDRGATGPTGIRGVRGLPGGRGPPGKNGRNGKAGRPGKNGAPGKVGPRGPQGKTGPIGDQGPTGPSGVKGPEGPRGPPGVTGVRGVPGARGPPGPRGAAGTPGADARAIVKVVVKKANKKQAAKALKKLKKKLRKAKKKKIRVIRRVRRVVRRRVAARGGGKTVRNAVAAAHTAVGPRKNVHHVVIKKSKTKIALVGSVINFLNNRHVHHAKIKIKQDGKTVETAESNGNGRWSAMLEPGKYKVFVKHAGFIGPPVSIELKKGARTETVVSGMSPTLKDNQVRFVLIWGDHPQDMDSHLTLPNNKCKVIYYNKVCKNYGLAQLDLDATRGSGPETITIPVPKQGTYQYDVQQYSNDGTIAKSGGKVLVFNGKKVIIFRAAKAAAGDKRHGIIQGKKWQVFKWVVDKDGKGKVQRYNK